MPLTYLVIRTAGVGGTTVDSGIASPNVDSVAQQCRDGSGSHFFSTLIVPPFFNVRTDLPWRRFWLLVKL